MSAQECPRTKVFISYSHADRQWLERLQVHLKPLTRLCELEPWSDTKIKAGAKWRDDIKREVEGAQVAVLLVSADFLASDFIQNNELPPLLRSAEIEGATILSIILGACLFSREQQLSQFQAINDPREPLNTVPFGEAERQLAMLAERIFEIAETRPKLKKSVARLAEQSDSKQLLRAGEDFRNPSDWARLVQIGSWIHDMDRGCITGAGKGSFLLSRDEYGEKPFVITTKIRFTNFVRPNPQARTLGMNAGVVFGWNSNGSANRYYNVLLTGDELLIECNGFNQPGQPRYQHLTTPVPFVIEPGVPVELRLIVDEQTIKVETNGRTLRTVKRPEGCVGRVGLRPLRSQLECERFLVAPTPI